MSHVSGNPFGRGSDRGGNLGRSPVVQFWSELTQLVRESGFKGILALVAAAAFAFVPLALLIWFNTLRFQPVNAVFAAPRMHVRELRHKDDSDRDQPGETGLLKIVCEVPAGSDGWQPLLDDRDRTRSHDFLQSSIFTRYERVYLRPKTPVPVPFGLLGRPPVNAWLPAGDYEVLVVYEAPDSSPAEINSRPLAYPFVTAAADCKVENRRWEELRIKLPHYYHSFGPTLKMPNEEPRRPSAFELERLTSSIERAIAVPTPGGVLLALGEPKIAHDESHQHCTVNFDASEPVPREWTADQLGELERWLPADSAPARERLEKIRGTIGWRRFLEGWYCYAAAGVTGLVFTRWGAISLLAPWRRRQELARSIGVLIKTFLFSVGIWFLFIVLTDGGCSSGPIGFRIR